MNQIKLYFLTGFLGSGKTTLLKNLLENMEGMKVGVIQNELGKISIDGTVLQNDDIHMVELNRGSIFCSCLRLSFVDALAKMSQQGLEYVLKVPVLEILPMRRRFWKLQKYWLGKYMISVAVFVWWTATIFWISWRTKLPSTVS